MTRYRWQLLRAGPLKLDAGSMFGVVPKAVWSRTVQADEQGRMDLAHNCLLLEAPGGRVLIETGSGENLDDKTRGIFGLTDRTILTALHDAGCRPDDIGDVIVSHLHFDHAGGLVRRGGALAFPRAKIHVQVREWKDALAGQSHMTRTYLPGNLEPIAQQLQLHDTTTPFPADHTPKRDELPTTPLDEREQEILPGIFVFRIPGHTWGQQAIRFTDDTSQQVVFSADLLPTVHHAGAAYNMAYDVEPLTSTISRRWFLTEAAKRNWLLVLDHEPGEPRVRVEQNGKGWFNLLPQMGHR